MAYPLTPRTLIISPTVVEGVRWARRFCDLTHFRMSMVVSMPENLRGLREPDLVVLDWDRLGDPVSIAQELVRVDPHTIDFRSIDYDFGVKRPRSRYTDLLLEQDRLERLLNRIRQAVEWDEYVSVTCNAWTLRRIEAALGQRVEKVRVVNELPNNSVRIMKMAAYDSRLDG